MTMEQREAAKELWGAVAKCQRVGLGLFASLEGTIHVTPNSLYNLYADDHMTVFGNIVEMEKQGAEVFNIPSALKKVGV